MKPSLVFLCHVMWHETFTGLLCHAILTMRQLPPLVNVISQMHWMECTLSLCLYWWQETFTGFLCHGYDMRPSQVFSVMWCWQWGVCLLWSDTKCFEWSVYSLYLVWSAGSTLILPRYDQDITWSLNWFLMSWRLTRGPGYLPPPIIKPIHRSAHSM